LIKGLHLTHFEEKNVDFFLMKKGIHIGHHKKQIKVHITILLFILYSI